MANTNTLLLKADNIVDSLLQVFPDPKTVPGDHRLKGRPGWVFVAESNPCMEICNRLTLELMELAPLLEQQLRSAGIELPAQKIRHALTVEGFETAGTKRDGRGLVVDRGSFMSEMRVLRSYFTVGESKKDGKPRKAKVNPKGSQTEKLVAYLAKHHKYENSIVENYLPAESRDIEREAKVSASTVSDFLKKEFLASGPPRTGYVNACKNEATLLHWFMVKFQDNLPQRTGDINTFEAKGIRKKW